MRSKWSGGVCAVWCAAGFGAVILCPAGLAWAMKGSGQAAGSSGRKAELTPWEQAERGLETLQGIPEESRTKADYATGDGWVSGGVSRGSGGCACSG